MTPKGFLPMVKVSGLDLAQAWSLKRTALKATAAREFGQAHYAWKAAIANNQADPNLLRGALRTFLEDKTKSGPDALRQSIWLLKLTATNVADLELVGDVLFSQSRFDLLIALLQPRTDELTPRLEAFYLKSLFNRGDIAAFGSRWKEASQKLPADAELPLYHSAYLLGWGPSSDRLAAQARLESASKDPVQQMLSCRLQLAVYAHSRDLDRYARALAQLKEIGAEKLIHRIGYWRLLLELGRRAEAIELSQSITNLPEVSLEAMKLTGLYVDLGLRDRALELLKRVAPSFADEAGFWIFYADQLTTAQAWEELRRAAVQIRGHETVRNQLQAYSYFLEGRAELGLHRHFVADTAFQKMAEWDIGDPGLGLSICADLLRLGYPAIARSSLEKLEQDLTHEPKYWMLLFNIGDQLKQVDLMLSAAQRAFALRPHDPVVMNNYAATLIIARQNPEEAVGITLRLLSQNPQSLVVLVNHSAALMLNQRHHEAEALLRRVNTAKLTRGQTAHYHLDLFELYFHSRDYDRAWAVGSLIDSEQLYPTQRQWLEAKWKELAELAGKQRATARLKLRSRR